MALWGVSGLQCRMCSGDPFSVIFGPGREAKRNRRIGRRCSSKSTATSSQLSTADFQPRSDDEIAISVWRWVQHAQPRALEVFESEEKLEWVLAQLARGTDRHEDAVLGGKDTCVHWYGDVSLDRMQAAIPIDKPGEARSATYVNRVLPLAFADDDCFHRMARLPRKKPFKMACGNQFCVNLLHISPAV
mmetsp:Transcript_88124/g.222442  ORF Transcript_88124/g.222442 Transcript_88124/m.222442 type:complete len:189 (+) Transcript_88124:92-658(+)